MVSPIIITEKDMKKIYSAPSVDIIILNTSYDVMDEIGEEKFSHTGQSGDSNSINMDLEEEGDDFLRPSRSLWE